MCLIDNMKRGPGSEGKRPPNAPGYRSTFGFQIPFLEPSFLEVPTFVYLALGSFGESHSDTTRVHKSSQRKLSASTKQSAPFRA